MRSGPCKAALTCCLATLVLAGCGGPTVLNPEALERGLVVSLGGISTGPTDFDSVCPTLRAVLPWAICYYDWPGTSPGFTYAFNGNARRRAAREIAEFVRGYRTEHPDRPVFLLGHSGGAAIAVLVAEDLGADDAATGMVLMAAPLHPHYDLTRAVRGAGGRVLNCYSAADGLLKTLVTLGQNFDDTKEKAAGYLGFERPEDASIDHTQTLRMIDQLRWDDTMRQYGHDGGHEGWTSPSWLRQFVVPRLEAWAQQAGEKD